MVYIVKTLPGKQLSESQEGALTKSHKSVFKELWVINTQNL